MDSSAVGLLKRAVQLDNEKRYTEALVCYQEGMQILLDIVKGTKDDARKTNYRQRIKEYMERAEKIKNIIEKEKEEGRYHEQIHINADETGHSYGQVFGRFIDDQLTAVEVEDPYIRSTHQIYNFLRFCELLVKSSKVKVINLLTGPEERDDNYKIQIARLEELRESLATHGVSLNVKFSLTLHDREIRFSTGWIIKIGRGLDYFKACAGKFTLGYCDYDLRPCHETTVDIFHNKHVVIKELPTNKT